MMKEAMSYIKSLLAAPSAETLALKELEEAKRKLLEAQSGREYANAMCAFHEARIKRLMNYLNAATSEK